MGRQYLLKSPRSGFLVFVARLVQHIGMVDSLARVEHLDLHFVFPLPSNFLNCLLIVQQGVDVLLLLGEDLQLSLLGSNKDFLEDLLVLLLPLRWKWSSSPYKLLLNKWHLFLVALICMFGFPLSK